MFLKSKGLLVPEGTLMPQFEMQPFSPGAEVPGAPVVDFETVQKSLVIPHWPQMLQHAFSLHGFKSANLVPLVGFAVPGT
jgi:hypothetical protein